MEKNRLSKYMGVYWFKITQFFLMDEKKFNDEWFLARSSRFLTVLGRGMIEVSGNENRHSDIKLECLQRHMKQVLCVSLALLSMPHPYMRFVGSYCRKYVHLWWSSVSIAKFQIKRPFRSFWRIAKINFVEVVFLTILKTPKNPNLYYINA